MPQPDVSISVLQAQRVLARWLGVDIACTRI